MKVAITGSSGYIGNNIIDQLQEKEIEIIRIEKQVLYAEHSVLAKEVAGVDAVINLAGAPIMQRWTPKNKAIIYNSRILTTKNLTKAICSLPFNQQPSTLISISAIGIYREGITHDETSSKYANHFAARVIDDWEDALVDLPDHIRKVVFRSGVVLGKDSQFIERMLPIFKLGLGGKIGNGKQAFPFIDIKDLTNAFVSALFDESFFGIYNLVAPEQVNNKKFTQDFAQQLHRPAFIPVPAFMLRLFYGKASKLILKSPAVVPARLEAQSFHFRFPTITSCLTEIFKT